MNDLRKSMPNFKTFDEEEFRSGFRKGWAEGSAAARRVAEKIGGKFLMQNPESVSAGQSISDEDVERIAEDWAIVMAKLTYGQNPWPESWPVFVGIDYNKTQVKGDNHVENQHREL